MSDIDNIIEAIQKQLQRDGISAAMSEIGIIASELNELQVIVRELEANGEYDRVIPLANTIRAANYALSNTKRMVGSPEQVLNEAIYRIRSA